MFLRNAGFSQTARNHFIVQLDMGKDCHFWVFALPIMENLRLKEKWILHRLVILVLKTNSSSNQKNERTHLSLLKSILSQMTSFYIDM